MVRKAHRSQRRMSTLHDVNVTNLIDVTMVLLIIFILMTPMIQEGFKMSLPKTTTADPLEESEAILVVLSKDGKLLVDGAIVSSATQVGDRVLLLHRQKPDKPVLVRSDESLQYGAVIQVIDNIRSVGVTNVGLVTENRPIIDQNR